MTIVKSGGYEFYIDERLRKSLDKVKEIVIRRGEDYVWIIDGPERAGKSKFGKQIAKYLYSDFSNKDISFNPEDFTKSLQEAEENSCKIFDEGYTGLSSRATLSEINRMLVSLLMEIGQKGLFIIIILPSFFDLDKYVSLWRSRGLFHVYRRKGRKGFWRYYNSRKKMTLYKLGKKTYSYRFPKSDFIGRFTDANVVNEEVYLKNKAEALRFRSKVAKREKYLEQRNILIKILHDSKMSQGNIAKKCKEYDFVITQQAISSILKEDIQ